MANTAFRAPRGTRDLLPEDLVLVRHLERTARAVAQAAGYQEVRPPLFEETRLFTRSLGDASDVVEKEMFTVPPRAEGSPAYSFRPEGTVGAVRAYVEGGHPARAPFQKWFYVGPMFRYERPQKGRERQFTQFGIEAFGSPSPLLDAEVVEVACRFFEALGFGAELEVRVNTMGDPEDRDAWRAVLKEFFADKLDGRCEDCRARYERNVFRLLDCKQPGCIKSNAGAPGIRSVLGAGSAQHHASFMAAVAALGRSVCEDESIVRGLDYYGRTVFEVHYPPLGARSALCGGGRYDGLVAEVGGPATPAVGFAIGFSATEIALAELGLPDPAALADLRATLTPQVFVVAVDDADRLEALRLAAELRSAGIAVALDFRSKSTKAQFKEADRSGAAFVLVLGSDERAAGQVVVRDMAARGEEALAREGLAAALGVRLGAAAGAQAARGA